jgi:copper chaperone CopZ
MERATLRIDGMSCDHCVRAVRQALEAVPGVSVRAVAVGTATVDFDARETPLDRILDAVNDEGYAATPEVGSAT